MTPDDWKLIEEKFRVRDTAMEHFQVLQETRHEMEKESLEKSTFEINRRLDEANKAREQINDERTSFLLREVYDREHPLLEDRVKTLEIARGENKGEDTGKSATYATIMGIAVIVTQVVLHFWK